MILQPSTLPVYFVVLPFRTDLVLPYYFAKYEHARKASLDLGAIVTNPYALRRKGIDVQVMEKRPRYAIKKTAKWYGYKKPTKVERVTINGIEIKNSKDYVTLL